MPWSFIDVKSTDPTFNLALEQYAFDALPRDRSWFLLWRNHNAIVIGRHQNTLAEINEEAVREREVTVVRRLSGGGAVYHDLGNLNFTFIQDAGQAGQLDMGLFCRPVAQALQAMGVNAQVNGRNDITIDGQKFSGNSQYIREGRVMHHGTILYSSDLETVGQVLRVDPEKIQAKGVFDKDKIALVPDHFVPNKDIKSAEHCKCVREFARRNEITNYFEVGEMGIEHALLPEKGLTVAGDVVIGADSHTCTYGALGAFSTGVGSTDMAAGMATGKAWFKVPSAIRFNIIGKPSKWVSGKDVILHIIGMIGVDGALYKSMEFTGDGIANLSMDDRFTIANMAIEAGGKNGIFPVDELAEAYIKEHSDKPYKIYQADDDAVYDAEYTIDLSALRPTVAFPHLPENTRTIDEIRQMEPIAIDQVVIGSCTNGRLDDMRQAAAVLKGRTVHPDVRCIVIPATQQVYQQCIAEGLMDIFINAHCAVSTPTCGPCLGGYMGILAAGERAIATTNRNFVGRMGDPTSEVYLSSPAVAAASAVLGHIGLPEDLEPVACAAE